MLDFPPSRNVIYASTAQRIIEVGDRWILLFNLHLPVGRNALEMTLQYHTCECSRGTTINIHELSRRRQFIIL